MRGHCRDCKAPISPGYLVVELITGALFLLATPISDYPGHAEILHLRILLVGLIFTDAETQLLPDKLTLPGLVAGLLFSLVVPVNDLLSKMLFGVIYQPASGASNPWLSLLQALMGPRWERRFYTVRERFICGARRRGHGLRRCQADGDGGRVPRNTTDHLHPFQRIDRWLACWNMDSAGGLDQAHPTANGPTSRDAKLSPASRMGISQHRSAALSHAIWRVSRQHGHGCFVLRQPVFSLVLEVAVKMLSNPIVVRMAVVLFVTGFAFWVATLLLRRMRRLLTEESFSIDAAPEPEQFPMRTYNAVIQQLKQQKHELLSLQQVERRRAKTSENISAAVLSNLSSGVLFLTTNGLVRNANTAAKTILGFASPIGMSVGEVFRGAKVSSSSSRGSLETLASVVQASLRTQAASRSVEADYVTPTGEQRIFEITISPVYTPSGETLGAACLITDKTEFALIQRLHELRGEMSAEMALALRNSVATISSYAQQLAVSRDPTVVRQLAVDIVSEAADLDHNIGGFLAGGKAAKAAGA